MESNYSGFNVQFERIKSLDEKTKFAVYGFIRISQSLLPSDDPYFNISELIIFIIVAYYAENEVFEINNQRYFEYITKEHRNVFHIYGKIRVERNSKHNSIFKWVIKTSESFEGRYGILNDDNKQEIRQNVDTCYHRDTINIGSEKCGHDGGYFKERCRDLCNFIKRGDVVTMIINFPENIISFHSKMSDKTVVKELKTEMLAARFIAEFNYVDSTIELL